MNSHVTFISNWPIGLGEDFLKDFWSRNQPDKHIRQNCKFYRKPQKIFGIWWRKKNITDLPIGFMGVNVQIVFSKPA